jgi:hypothetical protein
MFDISISHSVNRGNANKAVHRVWKVVSSLMKLSCSVRTIFVRLESRGTVETNF